MAQNNGESTISTKVIESLSASMIAHKAWEALQEGWTVRLEVSQDAKWLTAEDEVEWRLCCSKEVVNAAN